MQIDLLLNMIVLTKNEGHARALAEEGQTMVAPHTAQMSHLDLQSPSFPATMDTSLSASSPSTSNNPVSPSANRRISVIGTGNTTKVLAELQAGVISARTALENTKAQLRMSQRSVAQLTRQTEDLKDGRERLRLENEGLNNVVARKERLLQEVCEFEFKICNGLPILGLGAGKGTSG